MTEGALKSAASTFNNALTRCTSVLKFKKCINQKVKQPFSVPEGNKPLFMNLCVGCNSDNFKSLKSSQANEARVIGPIPVGVS